MAPDTRYRVENRAVQRVSVYDFWGGLITRKAFHLGRYNLSGANRVSVTLIGGSPIGDPYDSYDQRLIIEFDHGVPLSEEDLREIREAIGQDATYQLVEPELRKFAA